MNAQDFNRPAGSQETGVSHHVAEALEPSSFNRERQHDAACLSPGHYLIRLRQYHAPGSSLRKRRWFVTQS
jgi:hypothetical protein